MGALTLLNFLVGGMMGFILIKGDDLETFHFIFCISLPMAVFCLIAAWLSLRKANVDTTYNAPRLRKWRIVKEQRHYKTDNELQALEVSISGWLLSLLTPLFSFKVIWPDTFWVLSFNVLIKSLGVTLILLGIVFGIIKYKREKGANA